MKKNFSIIFFAAAGCLIIFSAYPVAAKTEQPSTSQEVFSFRPDNPQGAMEKVIGTEHSLSFDDEHDNDTTIIRPNFESAELSNFINYVAQITQINVIPTKDTQGARISLNMRSDLTRKDLWELAHTVLETSGFTIVKSGNVYKVVKQESKKNEPLPAYINVAAKDLPDTDQSIRFVTFLRNIQASEVESLLKNMLGNGGDLIRQDNVNGFIVTDKAYNIKSAMTIINELDSGGLQEAVLVLPLKNSDATEVKKLLEELTKSSVDKNTAALMRALSIAKPQDINEYFSVGVKIVVEERSNSLILLGNQKSLKKIEDFIATYIERENHLVESPIHRYQLEFTDATQIKSILDDIVNAPSETGADKYGGVRNGGKYFKKMRFEVDKDSNSLIVSSLDKQDWKMLKQTIKDLDKPQPQVAVEALIVDITLDDTKQLGSQFRPPNPTQPFSNIGFQSAMLGSVVTAGSGSAKNLFGNLGSLLSGIAQGGTVVALTKGATDVWAVFRLLESQTNSSLVDNGFVTMANRATGRLEVGERRRIIKQQFYGSNNSGAGYDDANAATTFEFTPQINSDGLINMGINVTMSNFLTDPQNTATKSIKTTVSIANGQVLVLGGFVKTKASEDETATPLFSKIPLLGWLFKSKNRSMTKTYTFIFLCPTIVKPRHRPGVDLYTKMKLQRARQETEQAIETGITKDPIHNFFFNGSGETLHHKITDFANARYQPTTVDIQYDSFYQPGIESRKNADFQDEFIDNKQASIIQHAHEEAELEKFGGQLPTPPKPKPEKPPVIETSLGQLEQEAAQERAHQRIEEQKEDADIAQQTIDTVDEQLATAPRMQVTPTAVQPTQQPLSYDEESRTITPPEVISNVKRQRFANMHARKDGDGDIAQRRHALKKLLAQSANPQGAMSKQQKLKQLLNQHHENPYQMPTAEIAQTINTGAAKRSAFMESLRESEAPENLVRSKQDKLKRALVKPTTEQKTAQVPLPPPSKKDLLKKNLFAQPAVTLARKE